MNEKFFLLLNIKFGDIFKNLLIIVLFIWAVSNQLIISSHKPVVLPILVSESGTRIITTEEDPILKHEFINFVKDFTNNYYNYSHTDVLEKMKLASNLMSEEYFIKNKEKLSNAISNIERSQLEQKFEIEKLKKNENGSYTMYATVTQKNRLNQESKKFEVNLGVRSTARSEINKYGLEIYDIVETTIN